MRPPRDDDASQARRHEMCETCGCQSKPDDDDKQDEEKDEEKQDA
jgi:hypothetical protein